MTATSRTTIKVPIIPQNHIPPPIHPFVWFIITIYLLSLDQLLPARAFIAAS